MTLLYIRQIINDTNTVFSINSFDKMNNGTIRPADSSSPEINLGNQIAAKILSNEIYALNWAGVSWEPNYKILTRDNSDAGIKFYASGDNIIVENLRKLEKIGRMAIKSGVERNIIIQFRMSESDKNRYSIRFLPDNLEDTFLEYYTHNPSTGVDTKVDFSTLFEYLGNYFII